ncbi:energy-coupling factor transporter ATP-binding protein EcfA2 [Hamadaea flava]|uniref:Type IV secretory system conjugative DNA transfer family protein n=1 Tax=Hamadaea flava TaxID=1742688 RepID=A0ABV8LDS1_9ACTN|nr:type IV secretion system DNA-binding domain-containing protein [Hamadaea flava]MCP2323394.1 energy-coupling factor transporter ATP-binding protein EcfA2 [Hamadaea flava]
MTIVSLALAHLVRSWRQRRLTSSGYTLTIAPPPEVSSEAAADFWRIISGALTPSTWRRILYGTPHMAWEYAWAGRTLTICAWVPAVVPRSSVEAAIRAAWPGATISATEAAAPIAPAGQAVGGALWPHYVDTMPLRSAHNADPVRALLAAGAAIQTREYGCFQVLVRPASPRRVRVARRNVAASTTAPAGPFGSTVSGVLKVLWAAVDALLPGKAGVVETRASQDPVGDRDRRARVDKAVSRPHFEIAIRYAVGTDMLDRTERLAGLAHTMASAAAIYAGPNRLRRMKMRRPVQVLASRRLSRGFLATAEELAAIAGLPLDLAVPGLERARAKAMPAPVAIPSGGRSVKVLGRAQIGGHSVGLAVADARQHVHLIGKTGTGKSTLLLNMILSDAHAGRGAVVIDPRGDLVTDILNRLPATMADRIVIIDPDQPHSAHFNPLEDSDDPNLTVDNVVGIFAKIFQRHWGPRMDDCFRVALLTLMRHARPTLSLVPPLLSDRQFRARFVHDLADPEGLGGFWQWYDSMNEGTRAQVIGPVLARLRHFLLRDFVKNAIGQPSSSFRMTDVLNGGGLLLCRLPKGVLGEETAKILGSLIVARTWQTALARAATPEEQRRDATLYIDEVQNFLTLPSAVEDVLAEARIFRLGLVLAHQNDAQLPRETSAAISANARTKVIFNVDPSDARVLAQHTTPEIDAYDLARLDVYTAAARLLVAGREMPAFTFVTTPPPPVIGEATAIRQACAAKHAAIGEEPPLQKVARRALQRRSGSQGT